MNSLDPRSNHAEAPVTHADRDMAALLDLLPLALVNRSVDMGAHLEMLAERIRVALSADGVLVLLGEPGGEFLRLRAQAWSERARLNLSGRDYGELWPMERGVAGWVMRTGESALVEDMTRDERVRDRPRPPESVIAAPLLVNGRPIGVVRVSALGIARFSVADQRLVEALARATGIAVENARLSQEAREHTEEIEARVQALTTLQEIGTCVLETMDSRAVVELVLERAMEVGPFDLGAMHLAREGNRLDPIALRGFSDPEHSATFSSDGEAGRREAMFHVLSSREPLVIEDLASYDGLRTFKSEGMLSAVIIPVRAGADGCLAGADRRALIRRNGAGRGRVPQLSPQRTAPAG